MISASGYSAFQLVFGSNPVGPYGWGDQDENLLFEQDSSVSGQFAQQWKLRMMAEEAALKEAANSKLKRHLAYNKTFNCADAENGDAILFNKAPNWKCRPKWGGPARVLEIDETGETAQYQSQTFEVAQNCARTRVDGKDMGDRKGPPGAGLSSDRYRTAALDPTCGPLYM